MKHLFTRLEAARAGKKPEEGKFLCKIELKNEKLQIKCERTRFE